MVGGIGFRGLTLFNDSLLGKQAWRLLHNMHSLFYRIFKTQFFPNCSFMEAKESALGSYAWKSILQGKEVIEQGLCFRKSIKNLATIWLSQKHPTKISFPIDE